MNVSRVELGINVEHLATFGVSPALNGYSPERSKQLFERLEDELAAQPGITQVTASMVPALGGSNWGSSVLGGRLQGGARHRHSCELQRDRSRLFQDDGHPAPRRARIHAAATTSAGPRSPSSTKRSRRSSTSATTRSASAWATGGAKRQARYRDRRAGQGCEVQRGQGRHSAAFLPAPSPGRAGRLAHVLRPHRRRARADYPDHPARWLRRSIRTCRSRTSAPWSSRSATTSSSIG